MRSSALCRVPAIAASLALGMGAMAGAQSLHRRAPAQPVDVAPAPAQTEQPEVLPRGTSLQVEIDRHYPMKVGEAIEGRLLHPIFAGDRLVVPANTPVRGKVVALTPNHSMRVRGRLRGDFTPFRTARVQFDELMLPQGEVPIEAAVAANGAPVLQLKAPARTPKRSFVRREWAFAMRQLHRQVAFITTPGRIDRLRQLLYHQLPYHPQRIANHTAWSFELTAPAALPESTQAAAAPPSHSAPRSDSANVWQVNALLLENLTSATARPGDPVKALVVEPVYNRQKKLVVPEGSLLIGRVTTAHAARSFGRNGLLRFAFQQIRFPAGYARQVEGSLAGASTEKPQDLQLDAEGTITPRNKSSVIMPMVLTMLATKALDQDGNMTAQTGAASNGFGLVGRVVGVAAGNRNLAAGIGFYATALSVYDNFLHSGRDVVFPKDTRIEIQTSPQNAPRLKLNGQ